MAFDACLVTQDETYRFVCQLNSFFGNVFVVCSTNYKMKRSLKAILIITTAFLVFAALILTKLYLSSAQKEKERGIAAGKIANIPLVEKSLKSDSLYEVRDVTYRDSAILIAVDNPEKSGTEAYFDRKYKLNGYDNINMIYVYKYDTGKPIQTVSFDDALMAKGKKLGKFQDEWVARYIDSLDGSCRPLKKYLQAKLKNPAGFVVEETLYQPENIHKMRVVCKYRSRDSLGVKTVSEVTALVDADGSIILPEKILPE